MRISVVTPVFNPSGGALRAMLRSVRSQTHGDWEHCVVDDGSTDTEVGKQLRRAARDSRVRVTNRDSQGGIVAATNDGIEASSGEFIAFLDHDDELHPDALALVVDAVRANPDADFLYSDEDKIDEAGHHFEPFLKPGWSPARLQAQMYTGHLSVMRRSLVEEVGRLRTGFDGSQDWDLALRVSERARRVIHIRKILYHWRTAPGSAAAEIDAKPWAFESAKKAVTDHFVRTGFPGKITDYPGLPGRYRLQPALDEHPLVSVVIPTAGGRRRAHGEWRHLVVNCARSVLERSSYPNLEVVVVLDENAPQEVFSRLRDIDPGRVRIIRFARPFNFSEKVNVGAQMAQGEYLLMLNDDTEVLPGDGGGREDGGSDWIESMLMYAMQPDVGSVGAKLLFADGRIQHAGIVFVNGDPEHCFYGFSGDYGGYFDNARLPSEYMCATAASLMVRREVFEEVGGFSSAYPVNFGDVDFGLKLHVRGYRTVVNPTVRLRHFEHSSRPAVATQEEIDQMYQEWEGVRFNDPYYHPGFRKSCHFMPPPYLSDGRFWEPPRTPLS